MNRSTMIAALGATLLLSGCGESKTQPPPEAAPPEKLAAGLYELTSEVTSLSSTDRTTPATSVKVGDKSVIRACVADNIPAPELLGEAGDSCEIKNQYIHFGRMSAQMSCKRPGVTGEIMPAMMGSFTADGFSGDITSLTYFAKDGDYRLVRKVSAKRVGDCPAGGAAAPAAA
jgi:hypothetical protein